MSDRKVRVGLAKEGNRRTNVRVALERVREDLASKLAPRILLKPNFFTANNQLTATHADAIRGVLDFIASCGHKPDEVWIAEGGNEPNPGDCYRNYGYPAIEQEYDFPIQWIDLNFETEWVPTEVRLADGHADTVRVPRRVLEHPCTISVAVAKTHDADIVTLALKNMIMGSLHRQDRIKIHGYYSHRERTLPHEAAVINANLIRLSRHLSPTIGVIDGTVGLQGNGPGGRDAVELGVAVASSEVFSADAVMATVMGFNPHDIGLFAYAERLGLGVTDLDRIEAVGPALATITQPFKPHKTYHLQTQWQNEEIASTLHTVCSL